VTICDRLPGRDRPPGRARRRRYPPNRPTHAATRNSALRVAAASTIAPAGARSVTYWLHPKLARTSRCGTGFGMRRACR